MHFGGEVPWVQFLRCKRKIWAYRVDFTKWSIRDMTLKHIFRLSSSMYSTLQSVSR